MIFNQEVELCPAEKTPTIIHDRYVKYNLQDKTYDLRLFHGTFF